tara:strand:- start:463 stop:1260 length:798 start_codon:yes stop_codon:yes gene_type:complete
MSIQRLDPGLRPPIQGPDDTSILAYSTYFDDFYEGGFVKDLALTDESDPSGGKFSNIAEGAAWNCSFPGGTSSASTDEVIRIADDGQFGVLELVTDADADDIWSMQLNGEGFKLDAGRTIVFETRIAIADADDFDLFIGLGIADDIPITAISDYVGFGMVDGDATPQAVTGKNSTGEAIVAGNGTSLSDLGAANDLSDGTASTNFVVLKFVATAAEVKFYVDGTLTATHAGNIPDDEYMTPTISMRNGADSNTLFVDYIYCSQNR